MVVFGADHIYAPLKAPRRRARRRHAPPATEPHPCGPTAPRDPRPGRAVQDAVRLPDMRAPCHTVHRTAWAVPHRRRRAAPSSPRPRGRGRAPHPRREDRGGRSPPACTAARERPGKEERANGLYAAYAAYITAADTFRGWNPRRSLPNTGNDGSHSQAHAGRERRPARYIPVHPGKRSLTDGEPSRITAASQPHHDEERTPLSDEKNKGRAQRGLAQAVACGRRARSASGSGNGRKEGTSCLYMKTWPSLRPAPTTCA